MEKEIKEFIPINIEKAEEKRSSDKVSVTVALSDIIFDPRYHKELLACMPEKKEEEILSVLDFKSYIVIDPHSMDLSEGDIMSSDLYRERMSYEVDYPPYCLTGAEGIYEVLKEKTFRVLSTRLEALAAGAPGEAEAAAYRNQKQLLDDLADAHPEMLPADMFIRSISISAEAISEGIALLKPTEENELLARVIERSDRLGRLKDLKAPVSIELPARKSLKDSVEEYLGIK